MRSVVWVAVLAVARLLVITVLAACGGKAADEAPAAPRVLAAVLDKDGWGFIDVDGKHVFDKRWPYARNFSSGLGTIDVGGFPAPQGVVGGEYNYIDPRGKVIAGPFTRPGLYFQGHLVTLFGSAEGGIVNAKGEVVARGFQNLGGFYSGMSFAIKDTKRGFVSTDGTWKFELPAKATAKSMIGGLAPYTLDDKTWGYIDATGKVAIEPRFEHAGFFFENRAPVMTDKKWRYIDRAGKQIGTDWDDARYCTEGRCPVRRGDKWGYVDLEGAAVIAPKFADLRHFREGVASVQLDGRAGYIDKQGAWVIEPRFTGVAGDFSHGRAYVEVNNKLGFIDRTGKIVIEPRFTKVQRFVDTSRDNEDDHTY